MPLVLRASPLATALYEGGLFFFDEINRVPERALSPLSSVLDGRQYIYSAMTGIRIGPKDEAARKRFRFCCALNPALKEAGHVLPEYIAQRTLPVVSVNYHDVDELREILRENLQCSTTDLDAFEKWYRDYKKQTQQEISARTAFALMAFVMESRSTFGEAAQYFPET